MNEQSAKKFKKALKLLLIIILAIVGVVAFLFTRDFSVEDEPVYGVTFSNKYTEELELDWRETYLAILDDLKVDHIRLIAYWDQIETIEDKNNFTDLDWQIREAESRNVNIILTIGRRTPRWPECHDPKWLAGLSPLAIQQQQLEFVRAVVERYKASSLVKYWQVENEPLFAFFGHCPQPSKEFLAQEVDLVRLLDDRPIILTDSGELNHWQGVGSLADTLGVTLYRVVWNKHSGFFSYFFIPPAFYRYKADLTTFLNKDLDEVIVTELQMEPWTTGRKMIDLTLEEQERSFDLERFQSNIDYTSRAGFNEMYFWGVEYWYWLKDQGHPEIWQEAKKLWQ